MKNMGGGAAIIGLLINVAAIAQQPVSDPAPEILQEIVIQAIEPRYVAPTRRDSIGRIWAPVMINDKGPFRLVLDTGASHSGITAEVASALGIALNKSPPVRLRGVTGTAVVPTIRVNSLQVGELLLKPAMLPIVTDALGGAQGILGTEGLDDKRISIDFRNDLIVISRSHGEAARPNFLTVPFTFERGKLLVVKATMGNIPVDAIIDTGGQSTIGNLALRRALARWRKEQTVATVDTIVGVTADQQIGEGLPAPPIRMQNIQIRSPHITFGDMVIFQHWRMTDRPAILIGMDVIGLLDALIIDYMRKELQVRTRS